MWATIMLGCASLHPAALHQYHHKNTITYTSITTKTNVKMSRFSYKIDRKSIYSPLTKPQCGCCSGM